MYYKQLSGLLSFNNKKSMFLIFFYFFVLGDIELNETDNLNEPMSGTHGHLQGLEQNIILMTYIIANMLSIFLRATLYYWITILCALLLPARTNVQIFTDLI